MAVNPPPIQEKTTTKIGLFPQLWIGWFASVKSCFDDILLRLSNVEDRQDSHIYWFDENDTATTTTPISHTGGASDTYMTNNGLGAFSNQYNPNNNDRIWDRSTNEFDFSSLKIGDAVLMRFDFEVDNASNNQEVDFYIKLGVGGSPYELLMEHRYDKSSIGTKYITFLYEVYMGNTNTLNNPAKIRFSSVDGADIKVNGWYMRIVSV